MAIAVKNYQVADVVVFSIVAFSVFVAVVVNIAVVYISSAMTTRE